MPIIRYEGKLIGQKFQRLIAELAVKWSLTLVDVLKPQVCPVARHHDHQLARVDVGVIDIVHVHKVVVVVFVKEQDVRDAA